MESLHCAGAALPLSVPLEEREAVADWLETARLNGIESVEDLCDRPWPVATDALILGVFRAGETRASWLVVGQPKRWAVASCETNEIIGTSDRLSGALALIVAARLPAERHEQAEPWRPSA
jgi:hypothetical protein